MAYANFYALCARAVVARLAWTHRDCLEASHQALVRRWRLVAQLGGHLTAEGTRPYTEAWRSRAPSLGLPQSQ